MASSFRTLRRTFRHLANNNRLLALDELNELIAQDPECWVGFLMRGRVQADRGNLVEAIIDSTKSMQIGKQMSERNRERTLKRVAQHACTLAVDQRNDLREKIREDPIKAQIKYSGGSEGRIRQIGKFLFDQKDLVKLENLVTNETRTFRNVRRLMPESVYRFEQLLAALRNSIPSVLGGCVFGRDGFLLASALPGTYRSDLLGAQLLGHYLTETEDPRELEFGRQMAVPSSQGYVVLTECDSDVIVIITNERDPLKLPSLHREIGVVLTGT
jgi:predicted regulator of Ras-like GTPase activity (Roadblock/LC7/MglB family)